MRKGGGEGERVRKTEVGEGGAEGEEGRRKTEVGEGGAEGEEGRRKTDGR